MMFKKGTVKRKREREREREKERGRELTPKTNIKASKREKIFQTAQNLKSCLDMQKPYMYVNQGIR